MYQSIYTQSPIAIEIYDRNGDLIDVNRACLDLFGIKDTNDLRGFNLFHDPNVKESHKQQLRAGQMVRYEVAFDFSMVHTRNLYPTSLSGTLWLDVQITPIQGAPGGFLAQIQDITKRKLTEQALRESEARWQFAIEGAGDGMWDWNAETNRVFYSRQWKAMLGYAQDEIGDTLDEWDSRIHPDDRETTHAKLSRHMQGKTSSYEDEHRLRCKDGTYIWVLDRGQVIEWTTDGRPVRIIGTHSDITARKRSEAERERLIAELENALDHLKQLKGLLPICAHCKKIRDDRGYWNKLETYIQRHSEANFSHSLCPECAKQLYPELDDTITSY